MSNATLTTTTVPPTDAEIEELSLNDADKLVLLAFSNLETAVRIYKKERLTQAQMVERLATLGIKCTVRTIKRVFADLRKQNDPAFQLAEPSQKGSAPRMRKLRASQGDKLAPCDTDSSTTVCSQSRTPSNLSPISITNDQLPERVQRCDTMGRRPNDLSTIQPTMGTYSEGCDEAAVQMDPNDSSSFLARDWHNVQQSDASDSFKRAHELLCEFEVLLGQSDKDGWTAPQFFQLATTLDSYHRSCANCSAQYREELRQYGEARFTAIERTLEGDPDAG